MIYKRPKNVTISEMMMYIDDNVYKETFDEQKIYEYLYHIIYSLASEACMFHKARYYEDFAVFGATRVYMRLTNKKQFQLDEEGNPRLSKIKHVKNYINSTLRHMRVDFEQSNYYQSCNADENSDWVSYDFNKLLYKSMDLLSQCEFKVMLFDVATMCRHFLKTLPYAVDSAEWINVYVSVMLTFMNQLTLNRLDREYLQHLKKTGRLKERHINDAFESVRNNGPILYHLPESMSNYIIVVTRELKRLISDELSDALCSNSASDMQLIDYITYSYELDTEGTLDDD